MWLPKARRQALARQFTENGIVSQVLLHLVHRRSRWDPDELAATCASRRNGLGHFLGELGFEEGAEGLYERSDELELRLRRAAFIANASISRTSSTLMR